MATKTGNQEQLMDHIFCSQNKIWHQNWLILIVANRLQTRLQTCLETGLQNKLQNGLFLFKIQLGTPQNIANEQLKHV